MAGYVGTAAQATGTTTLTPAWSGNQPRKGGHLLVALVMTRNNASAVATCGTPAGWSSRTQTVGSSGTQRIGVFWFTKFAAGGDAAPSFSLNAAAAESWCVLIELSGMAVATTPTGFEDGAAFTPTNTTLTTLTATAKTPSHAPDLIMSLVGSTCTSAGQSESWGGGLTGLLNSGTAMSNGYATVGVKTTSAVVSEQPSITLGNNTVAAHVALALKILDPVSTPLGRVGEPTVYAQTSGNTPSVSLVQTPTAGNLLHAVVLGSSGAVTQATLTCTTAGWTAGSPFIAQSSGVSRMFGRMFYKIATGSETAVAFSFSNSVNCLVVVTEWAGVAASGQHDADSTTAIRAAALGTGVTIADAITTGGPARAVISAFLHSSGTSSISGVVWSSPQAVVDPLFEIASGGPNVSTAIGSYPTAGAQTPTVTFNSISAAAPEAIMSMSFVRSPSVAVVGVAAETDGTLPLRVKTVVVVGSAAETDAAVALKTLTRVVTGRAAETDSAVRIGTVVRVGAAVETDGTQPLLFKISQLVGAAVEVDDTQPVYIVAPVAVGAAALYCDLGDVVDGMGSPVIWWLGSGSARPGDQVQIVGSGFGPDQATWSGAVEAYDGLAATWTDVAVASWERVAADPVQAAGNGSIDETAKTLTVEHEEITLNASDAWVPPGYGLRVRVSDA